MLRPPKKKAMGYGSKGVRPISTNMYKADEDNQVNVCSVPPPIVNPIIV